MQTMKNKVELQVHSNHSDGSYSVAALFKMAKKQGVAIFSITDHDSVVGIPKAFEAAKLFKISYIAGVELTVVYQKSELHLLGYGIDHHNAGLRKLTEFSRKSRAEQIAKMTIKLQKLGYQVSFAQVKSRAHGLIARPHLADEIIANPKNRAYFKKRHGKLPNRSLFIQTYIIPGKPAFVEKKYVPIKQGIDVIHKAGGFAFLSHPLGRRFSEGIGLTSYRNWRRVLFNLKRMCLDGIEVYAPDHFVSDQKTLFRFAKRNHLLMSGGSDFHNLRIPGIPLGYVSKKRKIPYSVGKNLLHQVNPKFTFRAK